MKTLVQMRNSPLQKLNKKRKVDLNSLLITSRTKLLKKTTSTKSKAESTAKILSQKKESNKGQLKACSKKKKKKKKLELVHVVQSLPSTSKDEGLQTQNLKRQRRRKKKRTRLVLDETAQFQRRVRYLLIKLKLEQNLIDAYSGEGWKGQSREKIKPERELQRAKKQILKCKLGLRDIVQQLDLLGSDGQIDHSLVAPDGSIHHEHIICKKCKSREVQEDNDIILCDGTCNCAFHQKCHDPPLATEDIPPEDEGWLCKYCDCKSGILETINAHLGTMFSADSGWEEIFKEEALLSENGLSEFNKEEEWPDDESDDNDYNPNGDGYDSDCRNSSGSEGSDSGKESGSRSSCCSLESEVFLESEFLAERDGIACNLSQSHQDCAVEPDDQEIVSGPRQRSTVDYRKLYDEMFGKEATAGDVLSEDEDWGPPRKRRREKESDAATTLMTLCETEVKQSCVVELELEADKNDSIPNAKTRKPLSRIPIDAVEKLRQSFAENELPSRADKRRISDLLGLDYEKVDKWFKNARYMALKTRKERRASHGSASDKSDSEADKTSDINLPKGSTLSTSTCAEKPCDKSDPEADKTSEINASEDPTLPISTCTKNRLKKVTWNSNLTTLFSPSKGQRVKKSAPSGAKAKLELSDDMSLKKHLLRLKAKMRKKRRVIRPNNNQHLLAQQSVDTQIEQLFRLEAKLQKLKLILSTIQQPKTDERNGPHSSKYVVYVPVAVLKEKS